MLLSCFLNTVIAAKDLKCSRSLQEILLQPRSYAKNYLENVPNKFRSGSDLLFTSQASSYIAAFEQPWGVSVSVATPDDICAPQSELICFDFGKSYPGLGQRVVANGFNSSSTTIDPPIPYPMESFSLKVLRGNYSDSTPQDYFFSVNIIAPESNTVNLVNLTNGCQTQTFNFSLADTGSLPIGTQNGTCVGINSTPIITIFKPFQSFAETLIGKTLLGGQWSLFFINQNANETLYIQEFTFNACYKQTAAPTCSSDIMHSLLNVPGFRMDSGIAYLTEEIYAADGQMRLATISRPIEGFSK